jgi:hypothetical protein
MTFLHWPPALRRGMEVLKDLLTYELKTKCVFTILWMYN